MTSLHVLIYIVVNTEWKHFIPISSSNQSKCLLLIAKNCCSPILSSSESDSFLELQESHFSMVSLSLVCYSWSTMVENLKWKLSKINNLQVLNCTPFWEVCWNLVPLPSLLPETWIIPLSTVPLSNRLLFPSLLMHFREINPVLMCRLAHNILLLNCVIYFWEPMSVFLLLPKETSILYFMKCAHVIDYNDLLV